MTGRTPFSPARGRPDTALPGTVLRVSPVSLVRVTSSIFGSAAQRDPHAADLDVGVMLEPRATIDYPTMITDLTNLTDTDVDLVHLNRAGPVIRERALIGSVVLFESEGGEWASPSTAAALERMDTAQLRRLDLELLAQ